MAGAEVLVELRATSAEFMSKMKEARGEVAKLEAESKGHMEKFSAVGKAALLGVAGAAVALGGVSLEMADRFEQSHAKLEAAIKATGGNFEEYKSRIDATNRQMEKFGFTNADTEAALAQFTISLKDPAKGMKEMGLAADLAKFKNIPLADSATIVAKAMQGQLRPLKALGIDLPVSAGGAEKLLLANRRLSQATDQLNVFLAKHKDAVNVTSKSHAAYETKLLAVKNAQFAVGQATASSTQILTALHQKLAGQASTAAETFAGKMLAVKAQAEDVAARIGMALIPIIESLIGKVESVVNWFEKHRTTAEALGAVIGGVLVTSIAVYVGGLVAGAASSVASFALMVAGWLGYESTVVVGSAATEVSAVSAFMTMAAAGLSWAASMVASAAMAMLPFLPLIALVAAVGFAAYELYKHWDTVWGGIKSAAEAAWHFIDSEVVQPIERAFAWVVAQIRAHWQLILAILTGPIGLAVLFIKDHFNQIVDFFASVPSRLAAVGAGIFDFLKNGFRSAINFIIAGWNSLHFKMPSIDTHIPGVGKVGGFDLGLPQIPMLANGTDYAPGGMAIVGERGPELIHLPRGSQVTPNNKLGGSPVIHNHFYVDGKEIATVITPAVRDHLLQTSKRVGTLGLA